MKKLIAILLTLCIGYYAATEAHSWHIDQVRTAYVTGLVVGAKEGELRGIFTCPCWDREGSFCSLCGTALRANNIDRIINAD